VFTSPGIWNFGKWDNDDKENWDALEAKQYQKGSAAQLGTLL